MIGKYGDRSPRRLAMLGGLLLLAGCGFHPLYGDNPNGGTTAAVVQEIAVGDVSEPMAPRTAQLLRNALLDNINPAGAPARPKYRLVVNVAETENLLAITQAAQVTRTNLQLSGSYRLLDAKTGTVLHSGLARAITAFNVLRIDYGNVVAEKDARARLAKELADKIRDDLAVWLTRPGAPLK